MKPACRGWFLWMWTPQRLWPKRLILRPGIPNYDLFFGAWGGWREHNNIPHNLPAHDKKTHVPRGNCQEQLDAFWTDKYRRVLTVLGAGGAGKTSEVLSFAWRIMGQKNPPSRVFFYSHKLSFFDAGGIEEIQADAEDPLDMLARDLAEIRGVDPPECDETPMKILERVPAPNSSDYLFILDNCETWPKDRLSASVSRLRDHGKIILTSRGPLLSDLGGTVHVGPLEPDQCLQLFQCLQNGRQDKFTNHELDHLAKVTKGTPISIRCVFHQQGVNDGFQDLKDRLVELEARPPEDLAKFLVGQEIMALEADTRRFLKVFHDCATTSPTGVLDEGQLSDLLLAMSECREKFPRWGFGEFLVWAEQHPTLIEGDDSARWTSSWGLSAWMAVPLNRRQTVPDQRVHSTVKNAFLVSQRDPKARNSLASQSGLDKHAGRTMTADERRAWMRSGRSAPLAVVKDVAGNLASASVGARLLAAWTMIESDTVDEVLTGIVQSLGRDAPDDPWANAVVAAALLRDVDPHADAGLAAERLREAWTRFEQGATPSGPLRAHLMIARAGRVMEFLHRHPEFRTGEPKDDQDDAVLIGSDGVRHNVVEKVRHDLEEALKIIADRRSSPEGLKIGPEREALTSLEFYARALMTDLADYDLVIQPKVQDEPDLL